MTLKSKYDVVILGAGHNGLVAAAYLARAGLSVLLLEKNDYIGGATTSQRLFRDFDANLSRYSYLVSLLPEKIIRDLNLRLELRTRATASFTPYWRNGRHQGLLLSNVSKNSRREALLELTGSDTECWQMEKFYALARTFAENVWDTMLQPLRSRAEFSRQFGRDEVAGEAWRALVEEPLGCAVERYLQNDLVRGLVFTDAKIGVFTHPHDESLLQNRCFLYHVIGNRTGEWKVPVGGMGQVAGELKRVAAGLGAEMLTGVRVNRLHLVSPSHSVEFEIGAESHTVDARFVLVNFGANVLAELLGTPYQPDATHEGSVLKINMLLQQLPRLPEPRYSERDAFCGTFHVDEGYEQMKTSYQQAQVRLPDKVPCEIYCHTLTDDSILSPELRAGGIHTLTLFALDTPWRLFAADNENMRHRATRKCLDGLNSYLAEPIEGCLARARNGEPCIETKTPVDIEQELGHYHGNIFHSALTFPFAETSEDIGNWGVETEFPGVFFCGSSARRGGAVSGIPGHNAAMKVLESLGRI
ncbi:MAG TPA: NAD(P)/FAD-dependent oxidoreductase [Candidatus Baltobacteraceae bacterium]|jgi:phytoene dehydrogenase-like protein|nr:NAD(P)/FAD-dependent oxidoreductase [Candidatus Baltobacteraceae bacterium]